MFLSKTKHLTKCAIALFVSAAFYSCSIISKSPSSNSEILFDGNNLDKWETVKDNGDPLRGWEIKDGTCAVKDHINGYDIMTKETYSDFELNFDFNFTDKANSGIKYLVNNIKNNESGAMEWNGLEYQIIDDFNHPDVKNGKHEIGATASLYLVYAPVGKKLLPAGQWNSGKIIVKGNHIEQWLNGVKVIDCERGSSDFRARMSATKFKEYDHYGELPEGHIMLTDHGGDKAYFRNIKIKRLDRNRE